MLVAVDPRGAPTLAARGLDRAVHRRCPQCGAVVVLRAGRRVVAHFAHRPDSACAAAGESLRHVLAKRILLDALAARGMTVAVEAPLGPARRADLLVTDGARRFTIEVQDSPITVEAMKARERADRRAGCAATCWIFTDRRVPAAVWEPAWPERLPEARLPDELRWRWHATRLPVLCLRLDPARLYGLELGPVVRGPAPARRLKTRHTVLPIPLTFEPVVARGRYGDVLTFARRAAPART